MKRQILIGLILVSSILSLDAQWTGTNPVWTNANVGIGTANPQSALHVSGDQSLTWGDIYATNGAAGTGLVTIGNKAGNGSLFINTPSHWSVYPAGLGIDGSYNDNARLSLINIKALGVSYPYWYSALAFYTTNGTSVNEAMRIDASGNIGIGTISPGFKLDVCGTIRAKEVKVDLQGSCDFVFKDDYKLLDLNELEKFVKIKQHLPEIAPEKEMVENGVNMKELQMKLLQKIEELTLYVIEQNKKNELQSKEIELLKREIAILKGQKNNNNNP